DPGTESHQEQGPRGPGGPVEVGVHHAGVQADAQHDGEEHTGHEHHVQVPHLCELVDQCSRAHSPPPEVRSMNTLSRVCSSRRTPCTPICSLTSAVTISSTSRSSGSPATRTVASSRTASMRGASTA